MLINPPPPSNISHSFSPELDGFFISLVVLLVPLTRHHEFLMLSSARSAPAVSWKS